MLNSLESSLIFPLIARLLPLYRFQGSLRSFRGSPQASLSRIANGMRNVKHFFTIFSKKMRKNFENDPRLDARISVNKIGKKEVNKNV